MSGIAIAGISLKDDVNLIVESADEATALADSVANPNNIYFWVELPPPPTLTSLVPVGGSGTVTTEAYGTNFRDGASKGMYGTPPYPVTTTVFVDSGHLTLTFNAPAMTAHSVFIEDEHGQKSAAISWPGGPA